MSVTVPTLKVNPVETSRTSGIPAITSSLNVAVKLLLIDHEDFLVTFLEDSIFAVARQRSRFESDGFDLFHGHLWYQLVYCGIVDIGENC